MQPKGFGAHQASIDRHLEMARQCLASSASQRSSMSSDDALDPFHNAHVAVQTQHGARIAAKIKHLQNLIAALTPVAATTEADQHTVFDRFLASVEVLWGERHGHRGIHERPDSQPRLVQQVHVDSPMSRHSLEIPSTATLRHRRVGSSRI